MTEMNPQRDRFCQEYIVDLNATQAAIRAGYSVDTAQEQSSRLLSFAIIKQRIKILMKERELRTQVSADSVVAQLANLAFSNMKNYAEWGASGVYLKESAQLDEIDARVITEISQTNDENGPKIKLKLADKIKPLLALAEHTGVLQDATEAVGNKETQTEFIQAATGTDEQVCKNLPEAIDDIEEEIGD